MIRTDEIDATLAEYEAERPRSNGEYWAELHGLRTANRALNSQLRAAQFRLDELDGAANTRAHQLKGELATWRLAAWAMLAVWLVTMGGILRWALD